MSLIPASATTYEYVESYFLSLRGQGSSMSNNDMELLTKWKQQGIPAPAICKGIWEMAKYLHSKGHKLNSLVSCTKSVEIEFSKWRGQGTLTESLPKAESKPQERDAQTKLIAKTMKETRARLAVLAEQHAEVPRYVAAIQAALRRLHNEPRSALDCVDMRIDAQVVLVVNYLRHLPWAQRRDILKRAKRCGCTSSHEARKRLRREQIVSETIDFVALPGFGHELGFAHGWLLNKQQTQKITKGL
jgi:hypothetical protein